MNEPTPERLVVVLSPRSYQRNDATVKIVPTGVTERQKTLTRGSVKDRSLLYYEDLSKGCKPAGEVINES